MQIVEFVALNILHDSLIKHVELEVELAARQLLNEDEERERGTKDDTNDRILVERHRCDDERNPESRLLILIEAHEMFLLYHVDRNVHENGRDYAHRNVGEVSEEEEGNRCKENGAERCRDLARRSGFDIE